MAAGSVKSGFQKRAAIDLLLALAAIGSLTAVLLAGLQPVRTSTFTATDFKTLYASASCFAHGKDAYSFADLQSAYQAGGVNTPPWFGHAPVYPPTTLALLAPLTLLKMVPAIWLALLASSLLLALAVAALLRYAAEELHLPLLWRMLLAGACAAPPIIAFGITVGNVSIAVAALSILAFIRRNASIWSSACLLAIAFTLKPHVALWVAIPMLLLPNPRGKAIVARAALLFTAFAALVTAVLAISGTLGMQLHGYLQMLHAEISNGASMSPSSHEVAPVVAQITSLKSLLGFYIVNPTVQTGLSLAVLLILLALLIWLTRRIRSEKLAPVAVAAWCAFGLLATYHRAHDAAILLVAAPSAIDRIRTMPRHWPAWSAAALYALMTCGRDVDGLSAQLNHLPANSITTFLLLRQAALSDALLLLVLLVCLFTSVRHVTKALAASSSA